MAPERRRLVIIVNILHLFIPLALYFSPYFSPLSSIFKFVRFFFLVLACQRISIILRATPKPTRQPASLNIYQYSSGKHRVANPHWEKRIQIRPATRSIRSGSDFSDKRIWIEICHIYYAKKIVLKGRGWKEEKRNKEKITKKRLSLGYKLKHCICLSQKYENPVPHIFWIRIINLAGKHPK